MQRITPFLTFSSRGKEAMEFYASIFKNSKVNNSLLMPGTGRLLYGSVSLDGQEFYAMDGGEHFQFADGMSLFVTCADQSEVDYYWEKLTGNGGDEGRCGWLKDQFGVSWQIVPKQLGELMMDPDQVKAMRVRDAMLKMNKISVSDLQAAHDGK